jgi:tetratricopeptide (TPR) repeat protein
MHSPTNLPSNRKYYLKLVAVALAVTLLVLIGWAIWKRSDAYQVRLIIQDAATLVDRVISEGTSESIEGTLMTGEPETVVLGRDEEADEEAYRKARKHYMVIIDWGRALAHARRLDEALGVATKIDDDFFRAFALARIAGACADVRDAAGTEKVVPLAWAAVKKTKKSRQLPVLIEIAKAQTKTYGTGVASSAWYDARQTVEGERRSYRPIKDRFRPLLAMAKGLIEVGRVDDALQLLNEAASELTPITCSGDQETAITDFSRTMVKLGHVEEVLKFANEIKSTPCYYTSPLDSSEILDLGSNRDMLIDIAEVFAQAGRAEETERLATMALEITAQEQSAPSSFLFETRKELYAYSRLATVLASAGRTGVLEQVSQLAFKMLHDKDNAKGSFWGDFLYATVAKNFALAGKLDIALFIIKKRTESGWYRHTEERVANWTDLSYWPAQNIAVALADADRIDDARQVMKAYDAMLSVYGLTLKQIGGEYGVPAAITKSLARRGKTDEAFAIANDIRRWDVQDKAYADLAEETTNIAKKLLREGKSRAARAALTQAVNAANRISSDSLLLKGAALTSVAKGWASLGDYHQAREIIGKSKAIDKLAVFTAILNRYANVADQ